MRIQFYEYKRYKELIEDYVYTIIGVNYFYYGQNVKRRAYTGRGFWITIVLFDHQISINIILEERNPRH